MGVRKGAVRCVNDTAQRHSTATAVGAQPLKILNLPEIHGAHNYPVHRLAIMPEGAFVIFRAAFGTAPATTPVSARRVLAAIGLAGLGIGFYDGLIGPGTGTFLVLALTALLAAFNLVGGMVGAHTALKKGSGFVRGVLLVVVFTLVANLAYQQWVA